MPQYTYACGQCGKQIPMQRMIAERDAEVVCACGGICKRLAAAGRAVIDELSPEVTARARLDKEIARARQEFQESQEEWVAETFREKI